jgi:hypothetical protein
MGFRSKERSIKAHEVQLPLTESLQLFLNDRLLPKKDLVFDSSMPDYNEELSNNLIVLFLALKKRGLIKFILVQT